MDSSTSASTALPRKSKPLRMQQMQCGTGHTTLMNCAACKQQLHQPKQLSSAVVTALMRSRSDGHGCGRACNTCARVPGDLLDARRARQAGRQAHTLGAMEAAQHINRQGHSQAAAAPALYYGLVEPSVRANLIV